MNHISSNRIEFPTVTFCNLNSFDVTSDRFTGDYINNVLIRNELNPTINPDENAYKSVQLRNQIIKASLIGNTNLTTEELKGIGFNLTTMMLTCFFNGIVCGPADFLWFYNYNYGNCYVFNTNKFQNGTKRNRRTTTRYGRGSGLVLELFSGIADYNYLLMEKGFIVLVNDHFEKYLINYQGINVPTGKASNIEVSKESFTRLDHPYSICRKNSKPISTDSIYFNLTTKVGTYSRKLCVDIYFQVTSIIPNCNCTDASVEIFTNETEVCRSRSQITCFRLLDEEKNEFVSEADCPKKCDSTIYKANVNLADYPTEFYSKILNQQEKVNSRFVPTYIYTPANISISTANVPNKISTAIPNQILTTIPNIKPIRVKRGASVSETTSPAVSESDLISSFALIKVNLESLSYKSIDEEPAFTFFTLLGVIGGQFGLFIGASLLSFIEVIFMIISLLVKVFNYYLFKKKVTIRTMD